MSRTSSDAGTPAKLVRFGAFELDIEAERLLKNGRTVRLQPQPFKLLTLLISLQGQLVTREQIRATLWSGDTFVDVEQGVNFAIKQVREALGEDADHPVYIQTVPRRGYRFMAPVETTSGEEPPPARHRPEPPQGALDEHRRSEACRGAPGGETAATIRW